MTDHKPSYRLPRSVAVKAALIGLIAFPVGVLAQSASDDIITISQKRRKYAPAAVTIKAGDSLRFVNDDIFLHHAFVDDEKLQFDSGSMEEGEVIDVKFSDAGTYQLKCAIHPRMKLDVTVE
jgi:plastocyanin